jgi:RNA polymerase sigma-70 factor, ECF subfamily
MRTLAMPEPPIPIAECVRELTSLQRPLYLYIFSLVPHPSDADDLVQETNRVIWEKIGDYQRGTSFSAWAYKIAFYEVLTYRKRKRRESLRFSDDLVEDLAGEVEQVLSDSNPRRQALQECLQRLSEGNRQIVARRYLEGADVRSVAQQLGRTEKAVYHALARIRSWLLECVRKRLSVEGAV